MPVSPASSASSTGHPTRRVAHRRRGSTVAALIAGVLAATMAGCAPTAVDPVSTPSPTWAAPTPTPTPAGPTLVGDGSAEDNLPLFTEVMQTVAATAQSVEGRAYIDALAAAGFDKSAMEVTYDRTTVDNAADSIQFSVAWEGECLIGQVGPSTPAPTAVVLPALPAGGCLIGETRPIDW